ncbi:9504_t:CDS:1, partial [Gigaspora rosea]
IEGLNENIANTILVDKNKNLIDLIENMKFKNKFAKNEILPVLVKDRESYE